jgi:hypothetical protein
MNCLLFLDSSVTVLLLCVLAVLCITTDTQDFHCSAAAESQACCLFHAGSLLGLVFTTEGRSDVSPKRLLNSNGLHGVISQHTEFFTITLVRASTPTTDAVWIL